MIKTLGKEALSESVVRELCKVFENEDWNVEDKRSGDQLLESEGRKRVAAIEEAFDESII